MEKLGRDIQQAIDQFDLGENIAFIYSVDLPFSDHVHRFITGQGAPRCIDGEETQAGTSAAFDEAMVLLKEVVEVFDLA